MQKALKVKKNPEKTTTIYSYLVLQIYFEYLFSCHWNIRDSHLQKNKNVKGWTLSTSGFMCLLYKGYKMQATPTNYCPHRHTD